MARLPRGFHPQAAGRTTSKLTWAPGWRGTGQQPIRRVPAAAYTRRISSVPLTGGQAQGVVAGIPGSSGSATSPLAFTPLTQVVIPVAGTFTVNWTVTLGGAAGAGDAGNFCVFQNNSVVATSVNAGARGTYPQAPFTITAAAGDFLTITAFTANATSGAVYSGTLLGTAVPLTLQVGPQGMGTTWYPLSVTLSTATGALDTSTALVYLGPSATPATLQGTVFTGNGTAALAIPSMSPGQTIIVTWTSGHPGDTAAVNITGTMSALGTG